MRKQVRMIVRGAVQGVGFRYFVLRRAQALGLDGEVKNRADGGVEVLATGAIESLHTLIEEVRRGPRAARVADLEIEWQEPAGAPRGFRITG